VTVANDPRPEPTPEEIEQAVAWMIREVMSDLREIARRRYGAVTIILQGGKPLIRRDKSYDGRTNIYGPDEAA
jgi:hypothetical protein